MKRDGFFVYTSSPRAALTSDFITIIIFYYYYYFFFIFFLEKTALHIARFKVRKAFDSKVRVMRCSRLVWQRNKVEP